MKIRSLIMILIIFLLLIQSSSAHIKVYGKSNTESTEITIQTNETVNISLNITESINKTKNTTFETKFDSALTTFAE